MNTHNKLTAGTQVICRLEGINGAIGTVRKVYKDSDNISVAIDPQDPALSGMFIVSPNGFIHLLLGPGEYEVFGNIGVFSNGI